MVSWIRRISRLSIPVSVSHAHISLEAISTPALSRRSLFSIVFILYFPLFAKSFIIY